jgi:glycerol uptake facilitator protein
LASYITGYGTAWRDQYNQLYWWVPIAAPIIGGLIGGLIYVTLIGRVLPYLQGEAPPAGRGGEVETPVEASGQAQTDTPRGERGYIDPTRGGADPGRPDRGFDPGTGRIDPGTGRDPRDPGSGPMDPGPGPIP